MPGLDDHGSLHVDRSGFKSQRDAAALTALVSLFHKTGIVGHLEQLQLKGMFGRQFTKDDMKRDLGKNAVSFH